MLVGAIAVMASPAFAFQLLDPNTYQPGYTGPLVVKFNSWDYGTLYAPGTNNPPDGVSSGNTNSWGILKVTSITAANSFGDEVNVWTPSKTESLEGMFYGISDDGVVLNSVGTGNIWSKGGRLDVYLSPAQNLAANVGPSTNAGVHPQSWVPTDLYNIQSDGGTLFLSADFVPGIRAGWGDTSTTYFQEYTTMSPSGTVDGFGTGYLSIIRGSGEGQYAYLFDNNAYAGGTADMKLGAHITGPGTYGWTVNDWDPMETRAVPEPASMLLLGLGALGMAATRKRKAA